MIKVKKVETNSELNEFVTLPFTIYSTDPNFIPPLISDVKETLSVKKNPFFKHAERELFLAYKNKQVVGRIAAIIDYNYIQHHQRKVGYFGFFESVNDYEVACALYDKTQEWLKIKGMDEMNGPANPSLNDECGFLYEGFSFPPVIKMSYNPPYYNEFSERYGMKKIKDTYAYYIDLSQPIPQKLTDLIEKIKRKENLVVRPINLNALKEEVKKIREIYNDAWSKNWDYTPLTKEEVGFMAKKLKMIAKSEIVPIVEINGEPAGISIALPNYNEVLRHLGGRLFPFGLFKFFYYARKIESARLWALGVKQKFQKLGVDGVLYYETFLGAKKLGYKWGEVSWVLEDNINIIRPIEMWNIKLYKKCRIYSLPLTS